MGYVKNRLPKHLAEQLPIGTRKALDHPCRRQILRALCGDGQRWSPSELARSGRVSYSLASTSTHFRSLEKSGLIKEEGWELVRGGIKHYFSSLIGNDKLIQAVLRATEKLDQTHLVQTSS